MGIRAGAHDPSARYAGTSPRGAWGGRGDLEQQPVARQWEVGIFVFAGLNRNMIDGNHLTQEGVQRPSRRVGTPRLLPILRDAAPGAAPQDEVFRVREWMHIGEWS